MGIFGTSNALNNSGIYDPAFFCRLDGISVPAEKPLSVPINAWPLCWTNATETGDHVFELVATSDAADFYVDQITYIPDRTSPPEGPNTVAISLDDKAVRYLEGSWSEEVGGMGTTEAGAKMSITFTGTSATFIGSVPMERPKQNSTGTYAIDGGTRVTFDVPGLGSALFPRFGEPLFDLEDLGSGAHELIVTYNGPSAPLVFNYLLVEGGDVFQSVPVLPKDTPSEGVEKKKPIGAIVGGVVGGVVVLAVLAILAFYWMKKRKQKKQAIANAVVARPPSQPHSPLNSMYEVKPLVMANQSPPTSFQSMPTTPTGDSSLLQQAMQPMPYLGHHANPSTSSHPSSYPSNPSTNQSYQQYVSPLAPARMSVSYGQQGPTYPRPPEPMM